MLLQPMPRYLFKKSSFSEHTIVLSQAERQCGMVLKHKMWTQCGVRIESRYYKRLNFQLSHQPSVHDNNAILLLLTQLSKAKTHELERELRSEDVERTLSRSESDYRLTSRSALITVSFLLRNKLQQLSGRMIEWLRWKLGGGHGIRDENKNERVCRIMPVDSRVTRHPRVHHQPPWASVVNIHLLAFFLTISQAFTTGEPMEEDILSDIVPSNIVSRQASQFFVIN